MATVEIKTRFSAEDRDWLQSVIDEWRSRGGLDKLADEMHEELDSIKDD